MKRLVTFILITSVCACALPFTACGDGGEKTSSYDISVSYDDDGGSLAGTVRLDYYNDTENEISDLKFNLWGNAYREGALYSPVSEAYSAKAYYNGKSYGAMTVENVENCSSWSVGGEDENILTVSLLTPIYPEDTASVTISYTLTLADVNHRTGIAERAVNLGNFYPVLCHYTTEGFTETPYYSCGDPFVSDCADYSVALTLPEEYKVAASGQLTGESRAGGNAIYNFRLNGARDFAMVLSKDFEVLTQSVNGVQVSYYYYSDSSPQTNLSVTAESLKCFCDTFGEYAYPTLSVVQTGFCIGGMEYPALAMISDELDAATATYTIVHENAHQWWYAMVGSDQTNDSWQDEGLAEYSTLMFFESAPNYGMTRTGMLGTATKAYRAFYSVYSQIFGEADTSMNRSLGKFLSDYEYANVVYNKGLLLFEAVRQACGDEKFTEALKSYCSTYKFKVAPAEGLIGEFCRRGDLEGVFNSFIEGKIII